MSNEMKTKIFSIPSAKTAKLTPMFFEYEGEKIELYCRMPSLREAKPLVCAGSDGKKFSLEKAVGARTNGVLSACVVNSDGTQFATVEQWDDAPSDFVLAAKTELDKHVDLSSFLGTAKEEKND